MLGSLRVIRQQSFGTGEESPREFWLLRKQLPGQVPGVAFPCSAYHQTTSIVPFSGARVSFCPKHRERRETNKTGFQEMPLLAEMGTRADNPVDVIEQIALRNGWAFERDDEDEISISVAGRWCAYQMNFTWLSEMEALHLGCSFDLSVPERRRTEIIQLIARINEHMWVGHFDLWTSNNAVMFRHALILAGGVHPSLDQCETVMKIAVEASERYYQAFQFVLWAGKSAAEAIDTVLFETAGEA